MRYIPLSSLMPGMVVGRNLYDIQQNLLLRKGKIVKDEYIKKIEALGFQGIYIADKNTEDIEIRDVISDSLRKKALTSVKGSFMSLAQNEVGKKSKVKMASIKEVITNIVDDIINNKDLMVNLIDLKTYDDYTYYHCVNVAVLSIVMGINYGLNKQKLIELGLGAVLHDVGKMFVDKDILNKEDVLEKEEYDYIKKHTEFGYRYLKETFDIPMSSYVSVLQHHERLDGTGYPNQCKGKEVTLFARIIAIADVYDALISNRSYRTALLPSEAIEYLMGNGDAFDTELIKLFITKIAPYPIGVTVQLSNGFIGVVKENFEDACLRPKVKIIKGVDDHKIKPYTINLRDDASYRNLTIVSLC
ncbi:HD-GYP domain-containing protein (c-di-GMP phosphodiesterase class II) [Natranaerovirga hydrolytica]|uniref:HD-GYP domain-containing protein (C-di-GMP phosphodiesterase class II) n=1 Tax=Natranaerovirga hydrolytica TaxID=680378 RepID=A0A4V2Q094_9FIRM|nr:HD-GYP domain-containing protein [Natranaerovirga hydrolytica]TCK92841.1 HD-GYP domain-containing protein (c-di-GMP phosphodiesterase class II) [Natranaerovirga hydrolytica]